MATTSPVERSEIPRIGVKTEPLREQSLYVSKVFATLTLSKV